MNYQNITFTTKDNVKIASNYFANGHDSLVIIAPGWCMTKDSDVFSKMAEFFAEHFDVLSIDFRGHGKSGGTFTFTAKETMDMASAMEFAESKNYKNIYLVGFSLGAASSIICAAENKAVSKVIAVSAPTAFGKIENQMWRKNAWWETIKKFELDRFLSLRMCVIPFKKVRPIDVVDKVTVPTLFVAGEKDPTVFAWHNDALYEKAVCKKQRKLFANGCHAEDLFLHFEKEFCKMCLDWLL